MKVDMLFAVMLGMSAAMPARAADDELMKQLVPTGKLRIGVAYAPAPTPVFVVKDSAGDVRGVPRDLGVGLAKALGVPFEVIAAATTGELADGCSSGNLDIGFMPVDDERRKRLDFSPPYFVIESTYLVSASTDMNTLADVDRMETTVVGIDGSTTFRAAGRSLKIAKLVAAKSVTDAMGMMKAGTAQALALSRDSLQILQSELPGSRIVEGAFQTTGVALGLHKDRPAALARVKEFIESAKADGTIRRAFDAAGLSRLPVAP
jgi:polar amino acid transport system substrate-binding protein